MVRCVDGERRRGQAGRGKCFWIVHSSSGFCVPRALSVAVGVWQHSFAFHGSYRHPVCRGPDGHRDLPALGAWREKTWTSLCSGLAKMRKTRRLTEKDIWKLPPVGNHGDHSRLWQPVSRILFGRVIVRWAMAADNMITMPATGSELQSVYVSELAVSEFSHTLLRVGTKMVYLV